MIITIMLLKTNNAFFVIPKLLTSAA